MSPYEELVTLHQVPGKPFVIPVIRVGIPVIPGGGTRELRVIPVIRGGTRKYRWYEERYQVLGNPGSSWWYKEVPENSAQKRSDSVHSSGSHAPFVYDLWAPFCFRTDPAFFSNSLLLGNERFSHHGEILVVGGDLDNLYILCGRFLFFSES